MNDPRDKHFYKLQKMDESQLNQQEIREYSNYCNKMIDYVSDKKSRKGWIALKSKLEQLL